MPVKLQMRNLPNLIFYIWKQKIIFVFTYREVDHVVSSKNRLDIDSPEQARLVQCGKQAQAIAGSSLSYEMLEHVPGSSSDKEMYENFRDVFGRQTLLNRLRSRRAFCTVEMKSGEIMLLYINRV